MLSLIISILGILFTILFIVGTHEYAHFITARLLGIKVLRFSIGFGKRLFGWRDKAGTEYVFALVPLGGYVKMLDENEEAVPESELKYAFNRQPVYKRFLVVLAGPLCNLLCAFVLYWIIFMVGFVTLKPIVGEVTPKSIAGNAGLPQESQIVRIDKKEVFSWTNVIFNMLTHLGNKDTVDVTVKAKNTPDLKTYHLDTSKWEMNALTPDPLSSLGIAPYLPNIPMIVGVIAKDSPAEFAGLKKGDKLVAINKEAMKDWEALITYATKHPDETVTLKIERNGKEQLIPIKIGEKRNIWFQKVGYLGLSPNFKWPENLLQKIQYGPLAALSRAGQQIVDFTYFNLILFGKLITGKLSLQSLGGPITIFQSAGDTIHYSLVAYLSFLAFLSISVGIVNFLPIPGLDGGHLFFYLIEGITGRAIPNRYLFLFYRIGFVVIFLVLIQALLNDFLRLST